MKSFRGGAVRPAKGVSANTPSMDINVSADSEVLYEGVVHTMESAWRDALGKAVSNTQKLVIYNFFQIEGPVCADTLEAAFKIKRIQKCSFTAKRDKPAPMDVLLTGSFSSSARVKVLMEW